MTYCASVRLLSAWARHCLRAVRSSSLCFLTCHASASLSLTLQPQYPSTPTVTVLYNTFNQYVNDKHSAGTIFSEPEPKNKKNNYIGQWKIQRNNYMQYKIRLLTHLESRCVRSSRTHCSSFLRWLASASALLMRWFFLVSSPTSRDTADPTSSSTRTGHRLCDKNSVISFTLQCLSYNINTTHLYFQ